MSRVSSCRVRTAAVIAALTCLAAPAGAGAVATGESPREVRAYWTEERMASAIPGDQLLAGVMPPVPGLGDLGMGGSEGNARGGQVNATRVQNPAAPPFLTHGKVFFTLGGLNYVCSGTSVRAQNRSLVATAGHCTYSEADGYASNFMFVPGYDAGPQRRIGRWTATRLKATPQWENSENIRYDAAFATMGERKGRKLANVVGSRGIAFNQGRDLSFDVFGYPAEERFDGERMWRCDSRARGTDSGPAPAPTRISCDMTGGSSGGGWVISRGRVNSVVSYGYECTIPIGPLCNNEEEGNLFGPYFGDDVRQLYRSQRR
jgi:V8-like Glu-specific endopeptidase